MQEQIPGFESMIVAMSSGIGSVEHPAKERRSITLPFQDCQEAVKGRVTELEEALWHSLVVKTRCLNKETNLVENQKARKQQ